MAFVRWRGNCAELLTTVYENGKSRQILLANLRTDHAPAHIRAQVAQEHPEIHIDWQAVERTLARGPKAKPASEPPLTIMQAENLLRTIAQELRPFGLLPWEAERLNSAADVLTSLRPDPHIAAICQLAEQPTPKASSQRTDLSSDDSARPPPPGGRGRQHPRAPSLSPEPQPRAPKPVPRWFPFARPDWYPFPLPNGGFLPGQMPSGVAC